jgi:hypothetical protein
MQDAELHAGPIWEYNIHELCPYYVVFETTKHGRDIKHNTIAYHCSCEPSVAKIMKIAKERGEMTEYLRHFDKVDARALLAEASIVPIMVNKHENKRFSCERPPYFYFNLVRSREDAKWKEEGLEYVLHPDVNSPDIYCTVSYIFPHFCSLPTPISHTFVWEIQSRITTLAVLSRIVIKTKYPTFW